MSDCVVVTHQTVTQFERASNLDIYHIACHYLYKMLCLVFLKYFTFILISIKLGSRSVGIKKLEQISLSIFYSGKRPNLFITSNESSQLALFEIKICALGRFSNFVSKHPAGTTKSLPSICK